MNSKTDAEFGSVNWIESGITKSCGNFRTTNIDVVEEVDIFSHVLCREKIKRGGCLRIYPRGGDIWAIYKNWSSEWNRETPSEVRHQYEMVDVMMDFDEEDGVHESTEVEKGLMICQNAVGIWILQQQQEQEEAETGKHKVIS
ncbi:uncharacterized protein LOC124927590 [Impatiens glandulifera]|uniref:uncharacterized protein LOC124927590 n=1 Tax=Impatiens glandulifera TaxID=253017 RepID=UPI001FB0D2A3|nr:uncharacterized protein LOC124927590 [Impatiens glandulifera]